MKVHVLELRPTQFALGMREVEVKTSKLKTMNKAEIDDFLEKHRVPVVVAKGGELHLIDHHHLVRACWEVGVTHVKCDVVADLAHLGIEDFWKHLEREDWIYLRDQFGKGPHSPELLPPDVRGMADDPFRSLAWELKQLKGFNKVDRPFCEFSWADFLRTHIQAHPYRIGFEKAVKLALELCHRPEAKKLPGYLPESVS